MTEAQRKHYLERRHKYDLENRDRLLRKKRAWQKRNRDKVLESRRKDRIRHPEKVKARRILRTSILFGRAVKLPCRDCGSKKVEAHHTDYSKPLEVIWLCHKHHCEEHLRVAQIQKRNTK
jgi:hypothetical protein